MAEQLRSEKVQHLRGQTLRRVQSDLEPLQGGQKLFPGQLSVADPLAKEVKEDVFFRATQEKSMAAVRQSLLRSLLPRKGARSGHARGCSQDADVQDADVQDADVQDADVQELTDEEVELLSDEEARCPPNIFQGVSRV